MLAHSGVYVTGIGLEAPSRRGFSWLYFPEGPPPKFREPAGPTEAPDPSDLTVVKGIGPKTKAKLADAGIADLPTLASADAGAVAEAADTSEAMAERWIEAAGSLI